MICVLLNFAAAPGAAQGRRHHGSMAMCRYHTLTCSSSTRRQQRHWQQQQQQQCLPRQQHHSSQAAAQPAGTRCSLLKPQVSCHRECYCCCCCSSRSDLDGYAGCYQITTRMVTSGAAMCAPHTSKHFLNELLITSLCCDHV